MIGYICENHLCEEHYVGEELEDEFEFLLDGGRAGCIVIKNCPNINKLIGSGRVVERETENFIVFRWLEE